MFGQAKHPRALLALCVFTVVVVAAVGIFIESSAIRANGSTDSGAQIEADYSSHLSSIRSMNLSAIEQAYTSNATVQFGVPGAEDSGNHTGLKSIGTLFGADMFPNFAVPNFSAMNSSVKVTGTSTAVLYSTFIISGYNADANPQSARVSSHVEYVRQGGDWLISFESWSFTFPKSTP